MRDEDSDRGRKLCIESGFFESIASPDSRPVEIIASSMFIFSSERSSDSGLGVTGANRAGFFGGGGKGF
jgi:hypothetical protein